MKSLTRSSTAVHVERTEIGVRKVVSKTSRILKSVNAEMILDSPSSNGDPIIFGFKMKCSSSTRLCNIEQAQYPKRDNKGDQRGDQRRPAQNIFLVAWNEQQDKHAHEREEGQEREGLENKFHVNLILQII